MSTYQYYFFEAIDKPLTDQQQKELRKISSRAQINSRRFENEYNWEVIFCLRPLRLESRVNFHRFQTQWRHYSPPGHSVDKGNHEHSFL